jgi:hypothetical protein
MSRDTSTSSVRDIRIQDCIENHERYVSILAGLPDKELAVKLDLIHIQSEMAERRKNTASLELLEIWRSQVIEARIYKAENNIPDSPNEIEMVIADIETVVARSEERIEIIDEFIKPAKVNRAREEKKEDENQMRMF